MNSHDQEPITCHDFDHAAHNSVAGKSPCARKHGLLGGRRAYMYVAPTHKMEVAFLLHSFRRSLSSLVVARHWNSVLLVSRSQQGQLHIRLTERELNGIAVINFSSMIEENFREFIDELHYNCCRRVKSCF